MRTRKLNLNLNKIKRTNIKNGMEKSPQSQKSDGEMTNKTRLWSHLTLVVLEYCTKTSIHGVQYLGEIRPLKEKVFWFSVFVISIYCASHLIQNVYDKWNETPVIVSLSEKSTPVWNIPFPAVTICSETKISKAEGWLPLRSFIKEFLQNTLFLGVMYGELFETLKDDIETNRYFNEKLASLSDDKLKKFLTLLHICNTQLIDDGFPILYSHPIDYHKVLDEMVPNFERYFNYCKWFSNFDECDELFTKTYTEEGICFTFNGLNNAHLYREHTYQYHRAVEAFDKRKKLVLNNTISWSLQNGYHKESGVRTYPARVLNAGSRAGLFIGLQRFRSEMDYSCRGPIQGFKVLLHSPDDIPQVSEQFVRIPMGREILIAVKPNMITTSGGIANYPPLRRQCYLHSERELKFFKVYTQSNCQLECLTNFTFKKCGCVKFSMPHTPETPICGENKIHCYNRAADDLLLREFTDFNYRGITECNCMPACTSLEYNVEISQADFDLNEVLRALGEDELDPDVQMSRLSIYFKENQFITSKRSELYGVTDFLANCGGIFGLFMGFSILSLVEIIYHFTLRLWSHMQR